METPARLVLVRHGESVLNELLKHGPFCPTEEIAEQVRQMPHQASPLTDRGLTQADELGKHLKERFDLFDVIIHSGYVRAQQTTERIKAHMFGPQTDVDPRFRERDSGYAYGMTRVQFTQAFPWFKGYWEREGWFLARPVGGESIADVLCNRIGPALRELFADHAGQRVLVVSHGRAIQAARLFLENLATNQPYCPVKNLPNCGYVAYVRSGGRMFLEREHP